MQHSSYFSDSCFDYYDINYYGSLCAGSPSAPVVYLTHHYESDYIVNITLFWTSSFTFSGYPVNNYTVTMFNHSDELRETITIGSDSYPHQLSMLSHGNYCYRIDFTVVAVNRLGISPPAVIHTGHPIGNV